MREAYTLVSETISYCPSVHIKSIGAFRSKRDTDQYVIKVGELFSEVKMASETTSSL